MSLHPFSPSDTDSLEAALRQRIRGEVRFDPGSRGLYATAGSNYRQVPIGVVIPKEVQDIVDTVSICRQFGAPVLSRGGGTSLAGQCCNVAVVMDHSKYLNRILDLSPTDARAIVEPGVVLDDLRNAAEEHHLTFAPDPSTHNHCTLGGMIGNNSCGVHSVMGGKTEDNVEELEILTYDGTRMRVGPTSPDELDRIIAAGGRRGEIYAALAALRDKYAALIRQRYPQIPRRVSGYNLTQLLPEHGFHVARALVGTEGTCVAVLQATLRLVHSPSCRSLLVLGYPDVYQAGDHIEEVLSFGPIGLEGMDDVLVQDMKKLHMHEGNLSGLPKGGGWLLAEFGAESQQAADDRARALMEHLHGRPDAPSMKLVADPKQQTTIWKVRKAGLGATAHIPGEKRTWEGWEDAAVPPARLGAYLRDFRQLLERFGYACSLYGHFGQGCVHTRIDFDLETAQGIRQFRSFIESAADLVVRYGGSLSGEHGDGQSRAELLPKMFGPELVHAFREFKAIWDPQGKMNPGKVVDPYRIDDNLRLGVGYNPPQLATHFAFPSDDHSFSQATLRCVGVGECRRERESTMCPSYRVTHEEMHSTRGRARLLFEMLQGDPVKRGWRDPNVKEALDLCLACKGCKHDCPVNVDMASYKAEFLSHHYAGRLRPLAAYSMGLIYWWARLASWAPRLVNRLTHAPGIGAAIKALGGIAPQRNMPRFAPETFVVGFRHRTPPPTDASRPRVLLWPDTFNNHFFPDTARAALEVLEEAGFEVVLPERPLCCGRPLYDFGMLTLAKYVLRQVMTTLQREIREGTPIVCLEPSCAAVFKDELTNLFPNDRDARRLQQQTFTFADFLMNHAPHFPLPSLPRKAMLHGHCHQKAVSGIANDERLLRALGLDVQVLDSGCCGMAGSFGFKKEHYEISLKVGELVLLPSVRNASDDTLIVADGFSCREQIIQTTGRRAMHVAEVMRLALQARAPAMERPSSQAAPPNPLKPVKRVEAGVR
jgi:FAD/FMN-containing dehydrogenase/Fe-S oxidoreductase